MATKNMGYDHPAYLAVNADLSQITGSGGATKFVAFTNMIVKSVTLKAVTAGTSNDVSSFIQISGTTTTTTALATIGSGVTTFTNVALATQPVLAQGDTYYVVKGTDATAVISAAIERVIQPLANVTV
jgi:hypothetical protein